MKLSVCIPTYNRAKYLKRTIESVTSQDASVQIVISDNASTDGTEDLVRGLQAVFPQIKYFRSASNRGADANYLQAIDLADGDYCWFLGSDDALRPGAVQRVQRRLATGCEILLANRTDCDLDGHVLGETDWIDLTGRSDWDTAKPGELTDFFRRSKGLGAVFSFLSTIVFKKERWDAVPMDESFMGSAYSHAYKLLSICRAGALLSFEKTSVVDCLLGNDSFLTEGFLRRVMLDFHGYLRLADTLFVDQAAERRELKAVLRRQYPLRGHFRLRRLAKSKTEWEEFRSCLRKAGFSAVATATLELLSGPNPVADFAWKLFSLRRALQSSFRDRATPRDV